ncbi:hypothetical protein GIB67_006134 [Kingdonia uniflora]|uniref:Cytochrome P450 n=1 Tax=Kingdonia uniflora TaxID=39325 RepID=A0A7J7LQ29_9MAGN|nr:hypothetical protein GIB67_006134 [Kingdonia uniflora]
MAMIKFWWKPKKLEKYLKEQGIKGSPYKLYYGTLMEEKKMLIEARSKALNLTHDIVPRVMPFLHRTISEYGKLSVTWFGTTPRVNIMDPELVREIMSSNFYHFTKAGRPPFTDLLVKGIGHQEGEKWAKHRRIVIPAFRIEKLQGMLHAISASCSELVSKWQKLVEREGSFELDVWPELQSMTADVISRTAFGSSFEKGKQIFKLLSEQTGHVNKAAQSLYIPGLWFLPTKRSNRMKEIDNEVRVILGEIISMKERATKTEEGSNDILSLLIDSNLKEIQKHQNLKNAGLSFEEVIQECKLFYLAGQEPPASLLTWTMVLLSMHPDWQGRAREEVLQAFGKGKQDFDGLNHLKVVTMIIYEVLRLYTPGVILIRKTYKKTKLGDLTLPAGIELVIPKLLIHRDIELWGDDANEFHPERFSEGFSKATKDSALYFPYGLGPRKCVGQNLSLIEAKMALVMILQQFWFELASSYVHAPCTVITLKPQYGAHIILHKL